MIDSPRYKELQEQLELQTDEKSKIDILLNIAEEVKSFDVDGAMQMANDIIMRARVLGYSPGIGRGLCLKGFCYRLKGEYDAGIEVLKEALAIARKIHDKNMEATTLYYLGNIHRDLGNLGEVLSHYEKALAINEELGEEFYQSVILSSIANLLYDLNDYDTALEYALKCLPIFERVHNVNSLLNIYNTLGNIYFRKDRLTDARHCFEENLDRSEPETAAYVMAESGLGKVYYKMNDIENAKKYLTHALRESEQIDNAEVQIICQYYLGCMYMDEGNYRISLQYLSAGYRLTEEYMRRHDMMSFHEMMSALYDKMGDIPKAFHHLKSFLQLKEEIFKQTIINQVKNLQVRQQIELAQKEKEVAERTAHLKHQFMANMSHEIRTPMNAIVGMTRLLLSKDPKQEQLRYLNAIQLSADNLLVIINDILDLSKIESGKIIIEYIDFSLRDILQSVRDMLLLKVEEKHIGLHVIVDPVLPKRLTGDPTRLNQILINLAGNAVKFTDKGQVEIKASIHKKEGNKFCIKFDVIDTGIGIAPEYVDTIFDSFTQAGSDVTRKFGGTGLGLAISKQLSGLMGGDITVTSELHKGTTFTTILPFEEAESQEEVKQSAQDPQIIAKLNRVKVLLVEDNEFNRMVAEDTLKELMPGIKLEIAINGQEAVDRIRKEMFDVVLMDIQMPVLDGFSATKAIRNTLPEPGRSVKIIAMTANVLQEDVQEYFEVGMNGFVSKPFQTDELLLKMDSVIGDKALVADTQKQAPVVVAGAPAKEEAKEQPLPPLPDVVTDMRFLKQFTGGNMEKQQKYIGMFLENAPKLLDNIDKALAVKDYQTIKIAAHSLKPQLSYMGVKEDESNIFLIEQAAGETAHYEAIPKMVAKLKRLCNKAFEELRNTK
jgi:signal transduction histidine kinase/DNA-binding NarL/FixJ family response regulator/HPt (histidine-containing phosphotransfer) domain-containing protein